MPLFKHQIVKLFNLWPPFAAAGIRITHVSSDLREVRVQMKLRPWNRNYVGTHYGGSLFSMADPFFMVMLMENLGPAYVVWDKRATIHFKRPGRGTVHATFTLTPTDLDSIRSELDREVRVLREFRAEILDEDGQIVAEVEKTISIKRR